MIGYPDILVITSETDRSQKGIAQKISNSVLQPNNNTGCAMLVQCFLIALSNFYWANFA